ncbi:MAG: substrate-binding domain-containing protein [Spirochaetales bacterium]|nr:substrate-binding domain-containing protein [Spirochaetales bacterium]
MANSRRLDGLIICGAISVFSGKESLLELSQKYSSLPQVCLSEPIQNVPSIVSENKTATESLIRHMIEDHNYKRIAFIQGLEHSIDAIERFTIYKDLLNEYGIGYNPSLVVKGNFLSTSGIEAVELLLDERRELIDAIIAINDASAMGAMTALKGRGLKVPDDIAVVGFDNLAAGKNSSPSLTTIELPFYDTGVEGVKAILKLLNNQTVPEKIILPSSVVLRESCGCQRNSPVEKPIGKSTHGKKPDIQPQKETQIMSFRNILSEILGKPCLEQMINVFAVELPNIRYKSFYFTLYAIEDKTLFTESQSKLLMAYDRENTPVPQKVQVNFSTIDLLPDRIFQKNRPCSYIIEPFSYSEYKGLLIYEAYIDDLSSLILNRTFIDTIINGIFFTSELRKRASELEYNHDKLEKANKTLTEVINLSRDISSILNIDILLERIIGKAMETVNARRGCLLIRNKITGSLEIRVQNNMHADMSVFLLANRVFSHASGETTAATNKPGTIEDGKSVICVPITHRDKKIGVCYVDNSSEACAFNEDDELLLNAFMAQAAIAIENAELYTESVGLISQINKLNEEKENQRQQLIQADKLITIGTLASSIAHELRNPNSAIFNACQFLMSYSPHILQHLDEKCDVNDIIGNLPYSLLKDKFKSGLNIILECSERNEKIINNLRNFYKRVNPEHAEEVDINAILKFSVSMLSFQLKPVIDSPEFRLTENLPKIKGNSQQLEQVIINLLVNSCHAIQEKKNTNHSFNEGKIVITTKVLEKNKNILLSIEDNGAGIDQAILDKIFIPFFTTKQSSGGSGLGLYISKNIIEEHNGKIDIYSQPGTGTKTEITFYLYL